MPSHEQQLQEEITAFWAEVEASPLRAPPERERVSFRGVNGILTKITVKRKIKEGTERGGAVEVDAP